MTERIVIVGSGAGGSTAAAELSESGYDVLVLERGRELVSGLGSPHPESVLGADELKGPIRRFEFPDPLAEPRVFHHRTLDQGEVTGDVNGLPSVVGGGTIHWDAKTPRFWTIDFAKRSMLGPVEGADVVDWPFSYADLAPYYDRAEALLGVQGSVAGLPAKTVEYAPRTGEFPQPPGAPQYSSVRVAEGAERLGLHPFPMPAAVNSTPYDGRPSCVNCGYCSGFGCPTHARGSALVPLQRAVRAGAEVRDQCLVTRVEWRGRRASGVTYLDSRGRTHFEKADVVVLAASAVDTCRLAMLSELPDPDGLIGRGIMFHSCLVAYGLFPGERVYGHSGRSHTHAIDDFADPDFSDSRAVAAGNGLPYVRGGTVELGFSPIEPITEGLLYRRLMPLLGAGRPFGADFKRLMRDGVLRSRMLGVMMHAEDLSQLDNTVELDPHVTDWAGLPAARISYAPHHHDLVAQECYLPWLSRLLEAAGATRVVATPEMRSERFPALGGPVPTDFHTLGGMRMAGDRAPAVVDEFGRMRAMDNVIVVDGSVFPTSGGHNPTLTIMATALRSIAGFLH